MKGKANIDDTFEKIKESMINEKNLDEETMNKNIEKVMSLRFFQPCLQGWLQAS